MPRLTSLFALFCLPSLLAGPAQAWGKTGHRVAGAIAQTQLSPHAEAAIADLLGREGLAEASTWPDFMRASPGEFWQREANPWHYVTVPEGLSYSETIPPEDGDAVTALNGFRQSLTSETADREEKILALRFIIHIIGDLHQPLHVGNGTDRGGNDVRVTFFREPTNLHAVWDSRMIDHEQLSYTELTTWLLQDMRPEDVTAWAQTDPAVWMAESATLRDGLYPDTADLAWDYVFQHRATYRTRLKQAGVRTAAYLNDVFAAP